VFASVEECVEGEALNRRRGIIGRTTAARDQSDEG
jgi:hypothetical protein